VVPAYDFSPEEDAAKIETAIKTKGKTSYNAKYFTFLPNICKGTFQTLNTKRSPQCNFIICFRERSLSLFLYLLIKSKSSLAFCFGYTSGNKYIISI